MTATSAPPCDHSRQPTTIDGPTKTEKPFKVNILRTAHSTAPSSSPSSALSDVSASSSDGDGRERATVQCSGLPRQYQLNRKEEKKSMHALAYVLCWRSGACTRLPQHLYNFYVRYVITRLCSGRCRHGIWHTIDEETERTQNREPERERERQLCTGVHDFPYLALPYN